MVNYKNYKELESTAERLDMSVREWMNSLELMDKTVRAVNKDIDNRLSEWELDLTMRLHLYFWMKDNQTAHYVISMANRG